MEVLPSANICRVARCQIGPIGCFGETRQVSEFETGRCTGIPLSQWMVHAFHAHPQPHSAENRIPKPWINSAGATLPSQKQPIHYIMYTVYVDWQISGEPHSFVTSSLPIFVGINLMHKSTPLEDMKQKSRNNRAFSHPKSSLQILVVRKISSLGTWEQGVYPWQFHSTYRGHVNNGTWPMCKNTVSTNKKSRNHVGTPFCIASRSPSPTSWQPSHCHSYGTNRKKTRRFRSWLCDFHRAARYPPAVHLPFHKHRQTLSH